MKLTAAHYDIDTLEPTVLLHEDDCALLGVREGDRVRIGGGRCSTGIVSMSDTLVERGTALMTDRLLSACRAGPGAEVEVSHCPVPESVRAIRRKMDGHELSGQEIRQVVDDALCDLLSRVEMSSWLTSLYIRGMDIDETASYARAMSDAGGRLDFGDRRVFDFHSFGGLPGNKITPIVVSIVAADGLLMPKLSSRAISSASGTADFVETFCPVDLPSDEVRRITEETGGVFSWTGATDLAPAGDHFIRVQRPLGIDPRPQMLASIMAKKAAAGATDLVMDIPTGEGTKVPTVEGARSYARDLMDLGERLGMRVECAVTYGDCPLGEAVGPALEARECIQVLEGAEGHGDVAEKACVIAGMVLEMAGERDGRSRAEGILRSGLAHDKFIEIETAQGGSPDLSSDDLVPGRFSADIVAQRPGFVTAIRNGAVVAVAKAAGAPGDKGAGLILRAKRGRKVAVGDVLMTIYAESADRLRHAAEVAWESGPYDIGGMLLDRVRRAPRTVERFKYSIHLGRPSQLGE